MSYSTCVAFRASHSFPSLSASFKGCRHRGASISRLLSAIPVPRPSVPHVPVLVSEILDYIRGIRRGPGQRLIVVDGTVGAGGHAQAILEALGREEIERYIGIDKDPAALELAGKLLGDWNSIVTLKTGDFGKWKDWETEMDLAMGEADALLLDIGVSSMQVNDASRGFSFLHDGPLDMRMDGGAAGEMSAKDVVNQFSEDDLARIFSQLGEEPQAGRMAQRIVQERRRCGPIETTGHLADVLAQGRRVNRRGVHPATLCFQALRIFVNDELGALDRALPSAVEALRPGGRLMVISFHSLEDRIVKSHFREMKQTDGGVEILTKKPVVPSKEEVDSNPRARSAKLRAVEKRLPGERLKSKKVNKYCAKHETTT